MAEEIHRGWIRSTNLAQTDERRTPPSLSPRWLSITATAVARDTVRIENRKDHVMKLRPTDIAVAVLAATADFAGLAYAQAAKAPAAPVAYPAAYKTTISTKSPEDWIVYDDETYTPVVDDVSRHLDAAREDFDVNDMKKAAVELRAVADELRRQAARVAKNGAVTVTTDKAVLAADTMYVQDAVERVMASALTVGAAAASIDGGQIKTKADLDKAIDQAARADMDRRWLVADVTTWYPVTEEPQRHFTNAVANYARKDYKAAAADIRKATSFVRLEAGRATGEPKLGLDRSVEQLDTLAASVEKGAVKDEHAMANTFANADHALAVEHRAKATESWARKDYDKAGYELKAAAFGLEGAAGWTGGEAKAGASATVAEARAVGEKLASGSAWTRDEVTKGLEALGHSIDELGRRISRAT
jgi:hypothetical protein